VARIRAREATPPAILDPILAVVERIERARRRIRPLRRDGILGVEAHRHRGSVIELADGTRVRPGDRIVDLHLDNRRIAAVWGSGWRTAFATASDDLRRLAEDVRREAPATRPVAVRAGGLLTAGTARLGFEVGPARGGWIGALEGWYLRGVLVRWSPDGRGRLRHGHAALRAREAWLSTSALLRRYGSADGVDAD
jgi:hypothetical protein